MVSKPNAHGFVTIGAYDNQILRENTYFEALICDFMTMAIARDYHSSNKTSTLCHPQAIDNPFFHFVKRKITVIPGAL